MHDDVELCLEVQVDPISKKILSNPEKCRSALLDVTVIKPKELEAFGTQRTNTLTAEEVRRLISSLEKERRKKQRLLNKLKDEGTIIKIRKHDDFYNETNKNFLKRRDRISSKSPIDDLERKDFIGIADSIEPLFGEIRRSLRNVEAKINTIQDLSLSMSQSTLEESTSDEYMYSKQKNGRLHRSRKKLPEQSIYRVETSRHNIRSLLCENRRQMYGKGHKIEGQCMCENCGIVGLLMECQKHPLLNELSESLPPSEITRSSTHRKRTNFNYPFLDKPKGPSEPSLINQLFSRIKALEQRLAAQEEKLVPRDYFKKIITKMVHNFAPKKSSSEVSKICDLDKMEKKKVNEKSQKEQNVCTKNRAFDCCNASVSYHVNQSKTTYKNDKATATDDHLTSEWVWRWGEEVLKPGIDLKNRIVNLLNDVLNKKPLSDKNITEASKDNTEALKMLLRERVQKAQKIAAKPLVASHDRRVSFEHDHYSGYQHPSNTSLELLSKVVDNNQARKNSSKLNKTQSIAYANTKSYVHRTPSPSIVEIKGYSDRCDPVSGKKEFLKILSKAKQQQKDCLWKNIWSEALANGQTKDDKITIKIPCQQKDSKGGQRFAEIELTIGEVGEMLRGVSVHK